MEKNKNLKLAASHKVEFRFDENEKYWYIVHKAYGGYEYVLSENNTWTRESDKIKRFDFLHLAINFSKRRNFNYFPYPEFTFEISNNTMSVFVNGQFVNDFSDVHSNKQASDILKEKFCVNLSKIE